MGIDSSCDTFYSQAKLYGFTVNKCCNTDLCNTVVTAASSINVVASVARNNSTRPRTSEASGIMTGIVGAVLSLLVACIW